jgi:hypothetical protein
MYIYRLEVHTVAEGCHSGRARAKNQSGTETIDLKHQPEAGKMGGDENELSRHLAEMSQLWNQVLKE